MDPGGEYMVKRAKRSRGVPKKAASRKGKSAAKSSKNRTRRPSSPTPKAVSEFAQAFLALKNRGDQSK